MRKSVILIFLALLLGGCAGAPIQEMSDARQALTAARQVVDDTAPLESRENVRRAQSLLEAAETQLRAGEYDEARRLADEAKQLAIEAREGAVTSAQ